MPSGTLTEGAPAAVDMLCDAMPFMTACGLRALCAKANVHDGVLCSPVAQLKYTCEHDEGMENMKGCDFWKEKCKGDTTDEACDHEIESSLPMSMNTQQHAIDLCALDAFDCADECSAAMCA